MKKFAFIFLIMLPFVAFSQRTHFTDSIQVTDITGVDTIINTSPFYSQVPVRVVFDMTTLDASDGTLTVYYSDRDLRMTAISSVYPITLDITNTTYIEQVVNGSDTSYYHSVVSNTGWGAEGMGYKFVKGSNSSGALKQTITK